jgi:hypothetical protein
MDKPMLRADVNTFVATSSRTTDNSGRHCVDAFDAYNIYCEGQIVGSRDELSQTRVIRRDIP